MTLPSLVLQAVVALRQGIGDGIDKVIEDFIFSPLQCATEPYNFMQLTKSHGPNQSIKARAGSVISFDAIRSVEVLFPFISLSDFGMVFMPSIQS